MQTVSPDNDIISLAAEQDYDKFYEQEILTRKVMIYPPYCSICLVGFVGESAEQTRKGANRFLQALGNANSDRFPEVKMIVLGPSPAVVPKANGKYRYRLLIKTHNSREFRAMLSQVLRDFCKDSANKDVTVFADINPENTF